MTRTRWRAARLLAGAAVLAVVIWRVGAGGIADGFADTTAGALLAGATLTFVTTLAAAWRWRLVAHGLGVGISFPAAVAAYYRSQFLNTTLPGGVLGDVHRGVAHGSDTGDVSRGLRAVLWERVTGQVVQIAVALVVLVTMPSPVRPAVPYALAAIVLSVLVLAALHRLPMRWVDVARRDVRDAVLRPRIWPGAVLASLVVCTGHAAAFVVAAHTAGVHVGLRELLPLAMFALLAMSVPTNIGGWGPREGATAWVFGAAGLGMQNGLACATVYGVMVFVATLPGAVVWVWTMARKRHTPHDRRDRVPVLVGLGGARG